MFTLYPGTRVYIWRSKHFKNDKDTPPESCKRTGTVVKWYGKLQRKYGDIWLGPYPECIDIQFDEDTIGHISRGHLITDNIIEEI